MRFAFETVTWGRSIDDLDLVLDFIKACGYEGVELAQSPEDLFVRDPAKLGGKRKIESIEELLCMLRSRDLVLVGLSGGSLERRMEFCGDYRSLFLYVEDLREREWKALNQEKPFTLGLHPHWFMKVQRLAQARNRLNEYRKRCPGQNNLLLLPDTAHLTIAGDDPVLAVKENCDRLAAIRLQDWTPAYGRYSHRFSQGFVTLGQGVVRLKEVLQTLAREHYEGWVIAQQDLPDPSPENSAFKCAAWLHEQGLIMKPDHGRCQIILERQRKNPCPLRSESDLAREAQLLEKLIPATIRGPAYFYQATAEALHQLYKLDAARLYSYYPHNEDLYLLAIHGMESYGCGPVLDANNCIFRGVIRDQRVTEFDLKKPENRQQIDEPNFLDGLRATKMITVPIFNPSNTHHLRYLLNLFPIDGQFQASTEELEHLGMLVSRLADRVVDDICSAAAISTSMACSGVKTRRELLPRLLKLLQTTLNCEAASIFLVDETGEHLTVEPEGTTGIIWAPNRQGKHFYMRGEGMTGHTWDTGELRLVTDVTQLGPYRKISWETRESPEREECIFAPIAHAGGEVLGVIRVVNKRPTTESRAGTMFTDEDAAALDSIIQAAIPYLKLLAVQERQANAIVRMTHEFQVPLVAIRGAVNLMQHCLQKRAADSASFFGKDYLGDVLNWAQLMGRLAGNAKLFASQPGEVELRLTKTLLKKDVIAPAVDQVGLLMQERRFRSKDVNCGEFDDIPPLWVDQNQFQQVFFNLLSNAIKYVGVKNVLRVRIEGEATGHQFAIWFSDWGMGVPHGLEDSIFLPGFRSEGAKETNVAGQGIGLFVVRNILRAHGGDIVLAKHNDPTMFEIRLPVSLKFPNAPRVR